jgi:hypothetical protein
MMKAARESRSAIWQWLCATGRSAREYFIGVICLLLSIVLFLPIPMGNMPPAAAICLFALAILGRDGLWVLGGLCATIAAVAIVWGVLFALIKSALALLARSMG